MKQNAARNETQVAYHRRRAEELKAIRSPWEGVWQGLAEHIEPSRLRLNNRVEGALNRSKIIDSTATFALRTLQSGMHSGITSPARPWFRLATYDPDLKNYAPVKEWLADVERRMREVFQASNVYNSFHTGYGDLGQFGQSLSILVEDDDATIRMQQLLHGRFWLSRDERGRVNTCYRTFKWSVERIVSRFGYNRCPHFVRTAWDNANYDHLFDVWHAIEPRMDRRLDSKAKQDKPFLSNYWMDGKGLHGDELLEESGFEENPLVGPAWELAAEDHYGVSPGMIALGDIKMLQSEQRRKLEAIDKMVRPPMNAPTSMRNSPASLVPGAVNFVDDPTGKGFTPAMQVTLRVSELFQETRDVQDRINRTFYADLFLMLSQMEGIQPRNTMEIAERKEEKLLALGPVLENIYNGQLEPVIDRTFQIMLRREMLPPPPPDVEGQELKVEYISMLAQAQKAIATGGIERLSSYVGNLAAVKPEVLDKFDADEAVDQYADMLGVDPSIVISDEDVAKTRDARNQKQNQVESAQMAAQMAPAAKQGAEAAALMSQSASQPGGNELLSRLGLV